MPSNVQPEQLLMATSGSKKACSFRNYNLCNFHRASSTKIFILFLEWLQWKGFFLIKKKLPSENVFISIKQFRSVVDCHSKTSNKSHCLQCFLLLLPSSVCACSVLGTLCNPTDCGPPGTSVHGILQARILEWVAISFSKGSSRPRYWTLVFCTAGSFFTIWATREAPKSGPNRWFSLTWK